MRVVWYPKNVLVAVVLMALLAWALNLALDFRRGATVGLFALLVYLVFDLGPTFSPGAWRRKKS